MNPAASAKTSSDDPRHPSPLSTPALDRNLPDSPSTASQPDAEFIRAIQLVEREIRVGLDHGFSELTIKCKIVPGKKRQLTVISGRSHQFTFPWA